MAIRPSTIASCKHTSEFLRVRINQLRQLKPHTNLPFGSPLPTGGCFCFYRVDGTSGISYIICTYKNIKYERNEKVASYLSVCADEPPPKFRVYSNKGIISSQTRMYVIFPITMAPPFVNDRQPTD